jgi:hypothetical protein
LKCIMKLSVNFFLETMWASKCQECVCQRWSLWKCCWWEQEWPIKGRSWLHCSRNYSEPLRIDQCCLRPCTWLSYR